MGFMNKILLLEDDDLLNEIITEFLQENGFEVESFFDGEAAFDAIEQNKYDMLLLDINVPNIDGFEILSYLREIKNKTPIIFITSLTNVANIKKAFDLGVNDYLKKPFDLEELLIRMKYHLKERSKEIFQFNNYTFNAKEYILEKDGQRIDLKQKEAAILHYFLLHPKEVISSQELIANIWQGEKEPTDATIRTYIKNLRKIFGSDAIENIKGLGYRFNLL